MLFKSISIGSNSNLEPIDANLDNINSSENCEPMEDLMISSENSDDIETIVDNSEQLKDLEETKTLMPIIDLINDIDCDFNFNLAELRIWQNNDIYCFLYGRKILGLSGLRCRKNWKDSTVYDLGKRRIKSKLRERKKSTGFKLEKNLNVDLEDIKKKIKPKLTDIIDSNPDNWTKSKIKLPNNKIKEVWIPKIRRTTRYEPVPGFNPVFQAAKQAYYYTIGDDNYYFGWSKAHNFIDITGILRGTDDWPSWLELLIYPRNVDLKLLGSYPFLIHIYKKRLGVVNLNNYVKYISKTLTF